MNFKFMLVYFLISINSAILADINYGQTSFIKSELVTNAKNNGLKISENSSKWIKRWEKIDLEETTQFIFDELSGTTSVNLKVKKKDPTEQKGYKNLGSFVSLNSSANPNAEVAYFNLAVLMGVDSMFRPSISYELGTKSSQEFRALLIRSNLKGVARNKNKENIIKEIDVNGRLFGCLKAKKSETAVGYDELTKVDGIFHKEGINKSHSIYKFVQANKKLPLLNEKLILKQGYEGDALQLSKEFSILLTFDVIFGQYDRFTGGNVVIEKDGAGNAHFVATDNGGAEIVDSLLNAKETAKIFSRYDKELISKLKKLNLFLNNPESTFFGYKEPEKLILDLGMYYLKTPKQYLSALKNNLKVLLNTVDENEKRYGEKIYF